MSSNFFGIIFADSDSDEMKELLLKRTLAAVPFGARYRMVDFALSNMTHAGAKNIGVIVKQSYQSLMNHVASGSAWDLDRKYSGLWILPPFSTENNVDTLYKHELEGLLANRTFVKNQTEEYVIITETKTVANIDYAKAVQDHIDSGRSISLLYTAKPTVVAPGAPKTFLRVDRDHQVTDLVIGEEAPDSYVYGLNTVILNRKDLLAIIEDSAKRGLRSLRNDVIRPMISDFDVNGVPVEESVLFVDSAEGYLASNLALLNFDVRREIFEQPDRPVITKVKDSPPTKYGKNALVQNSLIADGAVINGTVRNSVIFRGVTVEEGAVVENSVIMQNSVVGHNAELGYAILDKNVRIEQGRKLAGYITHPFILERNSRI